MGLVARIDPPSFETRVTIVLKKACARGSELPEPVAEYIANHVVNNIREIEGSLTRLLSLSSLQERPDRPQCPITIDLAQEALREIAQEEKRSGAVTVAEIQKAVALFYDVKVSELLSK